jgi:uncharacterized membrane protein
VRVSGVAAADVTAGTFGAGAYTFPSSLTVTNGLTVQAGTSALQAVTATTIVASSTISGPLVNPLTFGTHLTGSSYNNAAGVTLGTDATNLNTASTIVARDGSGNFSAGIVTATLSGAAPAGSLSGTTLAGNVVSSSLTTVGILASPHMTGAVVDSGGFTVTAGTAALQALTATTGAFSSSLGVTGLATFSSTILTPYTSGVAKTIWKAQDATGGSTKGPFQLIVGGSLFASTIDNTMYFGYNLADGGGNTVSTEPAFGFVIEQDYQVASTHFVESYFEWHDIGGSLGKRPIFWQFNRATGSLVSMNIRSNGMSFTEWDDATEPVFATLNRAGFILNGYATQTSDTQLVVSAQNGKFGALSLGGGFLIQANGSSARWTLGLGGRVPIEMTSNQVIIGGNGNFGGTLIVETPSTRVTNDHTLFLRAATSQTTNLLKAVASDGTTQVAALTTAGALTLASTLTVSAGGMTVSSGTSALQAITGTTLTASGLVTANAGVTVASGQTLTLTGATVAGTPTWSSSQAITLSTAAQPNITSVGTLTSITTSGTLTMTAAVSKLVPGATSFSHRNTADSADNLLITDAGAVTTRSTLTVTAGGLTVSAGTSAVQALTATTGVFSSTVSSSGFSGPLTGNASTATALATGRTIAITGDLTYTSPSFDGSGNVTAAGTLATVNANIGAFGSSTAIPVITVTAKGLVVGVTTTAVVAPAGTLTGTALAANVVTSSLTGVGVLVSPHMTGPVVDSGGLTVTAGTTAVQAFTATTATLSGVGTFNAGATIASGQTLILTGVTVSGAPTWSNNQAITLSTAAQPNVTSLGTLTSITTSGAITMTAAASKLVPGATSFSHRNTADSADNLLITDAGAVTTRSALTVTAGGLTVVAGTSALQAVTATSLTTTGIEKGVSVTFSASAGIGVTRTGVANTTDECYLAYFANDADGNSRKVMSISSKWGDTNGTTGHSVMRLNSDYLVAGVTTDDIQLRLFGGHGMSVFGPDDSTFPGDKAIGVYGTVRALAAIATPTAFAQTQASYFASTVSGATLMGFGTTGDVTLKNRSGTDVLVVTANSAAVAITGVLSVTSTLTTNAYLVTGLGNAWQFGAPSATTLTAPDHSLRVKVDGTDYYVPAKLTNT